MKTLIGISVFVGFQLFSIVAHAQSKNQNYNCLKLQALEIIDSLNSFDSDSVYGSYVESASGITVRITNTTEKKVYLFSSYFSSRYHSSKYINRVDKIGKNYNVSFLPLLPYLSTQLTDVIVLGSKKIVTKNQILFEFVELPPNHYYELEIDYENLFKHINSKNSVTSDLNVRKKSTFDRIKFKDLNPSKLNGNYRLFFDFAFYESIDILCDQDSYFLNSESFNTSAKSFNLLRMEISPVRYKHRLFN